MSESARSSRRHATGSCFPFTSIRRSSSNSNAAPAICAVRSPTSTSPVSAFCSSRAQTFTTSPETHEVPARGSSTTTSPVFTPTRIASPSGSRRCIASAAWRARSAWSSSATGAPKAAITASPANFSTVPPACSTSSAIAA